MHIIVAFTNQQISLKRSGRDLADWQEVRIQGEYLGTRCYRDVRHSNCDCF